MAKVWTAPSTLVAAANAAVGAVLAMAVTGFSAPAAPAARVSTKAAARRTPGSLPDPSHPAGVDTLPGIDHLVVLMLENHSFDNLFGMLGRGDGFVLNRQGQPTATNPYPDGRLQHAFHMPTTCQLPNRPSNEWGASLHAYDNGANDGFVRTPISPTNQQIVGGVAMGYWTGATFPSPTAWRRCFPSPIAGSHPGWRKPIPSAAI